MKVLLLLTALAAGSQAAVLPSRPVTGASFDGAAAKPWVEVPGKPFVAVGSSWIDLRAPGSPVLLASLSSPVEAPVLGIFELSSRKVINALRMGDHGVWGHADALPPQRDPKTHGGFVYLLKPDGTGLMRGSGHLHTTITPAVERAVLRHLGVRPAVLPWRARMKRLWLRALDWASALATQ